MPAGTVKPASPGLPLDPEAPAADLALAELGAALTDSLPFLLEARSELDLLRGAALARECGFRLWALGTGHEYRRLERLRAERVRLILPLKFPATPDVTTRQDEENLTLRELRHWDLAPENPSRLERAGIEFALSSSGLKADQFLTLLRRAVGRGPHPRAGAGGADHDPRRAG